MVVGFNLFPPEVGAFVAKFPEHSNAFNKYVKLSQTAVTTTRALGSEWTLDKVKQNPKQAAFLKFLAKKMKEKGMLPSQQQHFKQPEQPGATKDAGEMRTADHASLLPPPPPPAATTTVSLG